MIGTALANLLLAKGYKIIILSRGKKNKLKDGLEYATWNIVKGTIDRNAIVKADHIIHLAGAGVADKRWNDKRKKEIQESRTTSSALLVKALEETPNNVKTVVSASAIGWYGPDRPDHKPFVETDPAHDDFLGETCRLWEESIEPVTKLGKRLVKLRTGIVLSKQGGALDEFKKPLYAGVAAILSNGKQVVSWIHIDDLCRMYLEAIENPLLEGAYNAVAPKPVSNKELTVQLAKRMKGSFFISLHVPAFMLKLVLGEMSIEVLKSTTVSANKIRKTGFDFIYPTIEAAINEIIGNN